MKYRLSALLVVLFLTSIVPALTAEQADFGTVVISPPEDALTLARVLHEGAPRLISVTNYEQGTITGHVLDVATDDPITAFQTLGFQGLVELVTEPGLALQVSASDLLIPVALGNSHIAAGTNFSEHAAEATVEDGPFLFPKAVQPTGPYANVSAGDGLLDYEVELCFVGFDPIHLDRLPAHVGLFLCNDYTNRAKLMRHIDPFDVTSGNGFTTGKSAPGFMPIGNLFVIPRDHATFVPSVELTLYLNGERRQNALQSQAIWGLEDILQQVALRYDVTWAYNGTDVGLSLVENTIPVRTAILGGTPSGTLFQGLAFSQQVSGTLKWLAGGWDKPFAHWIIETYIVDAQESEAFLQPGDEVTIHVDRLGVISNKVVE